jgi:hypothetical protein
MTMKMQRHGRPKATAIKPARSKEIGPAGGMAERTPRSREMPQTNGNVAIQSESRGRPSLSLFDWDNGARRGLIDAHREGRRLVGKYTNLTDPKITRPWIGLIVSNQTDVGAEDVWISVDNAKRSTCQSSPVDQARLRFAAASSAVVRCSTA